MKIAVVSRSWPSNERSGVSLAAATHVRMLVELGYQVSIIGASPEVTKINDVPLIHRVWVPSQGSGALYSKARVDLGALRDALRNIKPNLILVEAWQTSLTDAAIDEASRLKIPVLMISHGVAVHPHDLSLAQWFRALCWIPYRLFRLPSLLKKVSAITCLDESSSSPRFFDRNMAKKMGIKIFPLKNLPIHFTEEFIPRQKRSPQILVIGYFSGVKNQIAAINVFSNLRFPITLKFIGPRYGRYYKACIQLANKLGLCGKISFLEDDECNLAEEIASSTLVYLPSLTEALPTTLIEAMACGTPFVASAVGAIPHMRGGIATNDPQLQEKALQDLIEDDHLWASYANLGRLQYQEEFSYQRIKSQLDRAVKYCVKSDLRFSALK